MKERAQEYAVFRAPVGPHIKWIIPIPLILDIVRTVLDLKAGSPGSTDRFAVGRMMS
jgi:hypothetical protein